MMIYYCYNEEYFGHLYFLRNVAKFSWSLRFHRNCSILSILIFRCHDWKLYYSLLLLRSLRYSMVLSRIPFPDIAHAHCTSPCLRSPRVCGSGRFNRDHCTSLTSALNVRPRVGFLKCITNWIFYIFSNITCLPTFLLLGQNWTPTIQSSEPEAQQSYWPPASSNTPCSRSTMVSWICLLLSPHCSSSSSVPSFCPLDLAVVSSLCSSLWSSLLKIIKKAVQEGEPLKLSAGNSQRFLVMYTMQGKVNAWHDIQDACDPVLTLLSNPILVTSYLVLWW